LGRGVTIRRLSTATSVVHVKVVPSFVHTPSDYYSNRGWRCNYTVPRFGIGYTFVPVACELLAVIGLFSGNDTTAQNRRNAYPIA
jgi:hypothetical protein